MVPNFMCFSPGRGRWGTVDTILHFQLLLLYFKSKQAQILSQNKETLHTHIMPKHENNALQKKNCNQFKEGSFSVQVSQVLVRPGGESISGPTSA